MEERKINYFRSDENFEKAKGSPPITRHDREEEKSALSSRRAKIN